MMDGIVGKAKTSETHGIGIQYHFIFALRHKETVIGKGFRRTEIEHEHQVLAHVSQDLISIVIPDFFVSEWTGSSSRYEAVPASRGQNHLRNDISSPYYRPNPIGGVHTYATNRFLRAENRSIPDGRIHSPIKFRYPPLMVEAVTRRIILCKATPRSTIKLWSSFCMCQYISASIRRKMIVLSPTNAWS